MTFGQTSEVPRAESWWTVDEVWVSGTSLYYITGPARALHERRDWRRDERGRCALEAFTALPLEAMYGRLKTYREELRGVPDATPDQERLRAALRELIDLVLEFGPLGLEANRTFPVEVSEAEAWRREGEELRWQRDGLTPDPMQQAEYLRATMPRWRVTFPGPGEPGLPRVSTFRTYPGLELGGARAARR